MYNADLVCRAVACRWSSIDADLCPSGREWRPLRSFFGVSRTCSLALGQPALPWKPGGENVANLGSKLAQGLGHCVWGWAFCCLPGPRLPLPWMELGNPAKFSLQPSNIRLFSEYLSMPAGDFGGTGNRVALRLATGRPRTFCAISTEYDNCAGASLQLLWPLSRLLWGLGNPDLFLVL